MTKRITSDSPANRSQDIIGLTLQLQKFSVGTPSHIRHQGSNTVLGHYDNLLIRKITKWLDFSPRMDWEGNRDTDASQKADVLATHYPIKLLFPEREIVDQQPCFAYEGWKAPETLLKDNPCMTVVLINLTDAYRRVAGKQLLQSFLQLLSENCSDQLKQVQCCVLPSIGYSDFCIPVAGSKWKPALDLVDRLHGLMIESAGYGSVVVLSTDYMMPVYHQQKGHSFYEYFDGLQLMVRVNLSPGVTAQQLASNLPDVQVYRTSGGSDCVLSAERETGQRMLADFLLDGRSGSFVIDIVSAPQLLMSPSPDAAEPEPGSQRIPDRQYIVRFETSIKLYAEQLKKYNRHDRQINSLWELSALIENTCSRPHTGDLRKIIQDLLENFSYCLELCAERMQLPDWDFDDMEYGVNKFSSIVGDFLSDLSRSDCFFMEREKYNHASVSSATGLLIAYNQWLNRFTHAVSRVTQPENQSEYAFLVTSGGRDQTQTAEMFCFLEPKMQDNGQLYEKVPLLTQMSEMSLFDFSGTILRAAHECMHFSGVRQRSKRVDYLLTFIVRMLSRLLANVLLPEEQTIDYAESVFRSLETDPGDKVQTAYLTRWEELAKRIECELAERLKTSELDTWDESQCLSLNVQEWLYNKLARIFSGYRVLELSGRPYTFKMNSFAYALYQITQEAQRGFFYDCDRLSRSQGIHTAIFAYGAKTQEVFGQHIGADKTLTTAIQLILSRLLITELASTMPVNKKEKDYDEWELVFPYVTLISSNINNILKSSVDIFKETFADVMACEVLGASFEDYLLMHVYEDWDLKSALPCDMANVYRIPAVLWLCFPTCMDDGQIKLGAEAHNRVKAAIQCLVEHGMPNDRLNADTLCDRVNEMLAEFKKKEYIGTPLLDYLRLCKADYSKDSVKAELKPFADSYHAIRLLSIQPGTPDFHKKLLSMYRALIDRGGDYHNDAAIEMRKVAAVR